MFGLFGKKTYKPTVTTEDKDWIEKNFIWFIEVFGLEKLKVHPYILPTHENFPFSDLKNPEQFQLLFEQLCKDWSVNPDEIQVKFFDDIKSKQWTTFVPHGKVHDPGGIYHQNYTTDQKRFTIQLAKSNLNNVQLLISVLTHEIAHVKLLGGNFVNRNDQDMEPLTDLATIYFGFGIFVANSAHTQDDGWISRSGYLPSQIISYANALICYITNQDASNFYTYFNLNTKEYLKQDFEFLINTNDTLLTKDKVLKCETRFQIGNQISEGFEKRNFEAAIEGSKKILESNPKDVGSYNNIGYALLQQKKYSAAIDAFTKAIDIEPYWDYPYNNRGYCRLQLGDIDGAFTDLHTSFEMNPENSFSWRNLGAYYLKTNELEKALTHFEEALKTDPKTELINFYLGQTYLKMGNTDKAKLYLDKSKELNEYNDSIIA